MTPFGLKLNASVSLAQDFSSAIPGLWKRFLTIFSRYARNHPGNATEMYSQESETLAVLHYVLFGVSILWTFAAFTIPSPMTCLIDQLDW